MPVGDRLDRYELIAELGAGAFGVVFRARHLDMGREDAVKVPHDAELARQFVTEGQLVARLDHPNIVRVYAMNMAHDPPFIVYELVEGRSLRARMAEVGRPMDCDEVIEIARQVLAGLAVAHGLGIVHRDLKPENILLRRDGVAKISDFGLGVAAEQMSMMVSRSVSKGSAVLASQLGASRIRGDDVSQLGVSRQTGSSVGSSVGGTLAYMSPEQEDGLKLDGRSDLFALGILMYEAVTGERPRGRFKDPVELNEAVSECLNAVIVAALEPQRDARHRDAASMSAALGQLAQPPVARAATAPQPTPTAAPPPTTDAARIVLTRRSITGRWDLPGKQPGEEITGPWGIRLVWVPGGTFVMGSTVEDIEYVRQTLGAEVPGDEQPAHEIELSGYWIGATTVTVKQWRTVMGTCPPGNDQGDDHPVINVLWRNCREFCGKAGLEMPTEAQWEYAARSSEGLHFPWGYDWDPRRLCCAQNQGPMGQTFPVGSFPSGASWCGALDLAGNVWEWCRDGYDPAYYSSSPARDPLARIIHDRCSWAVVGAA